MTQESSTISTWFPEKMQCVFSNKRYIVMYGGRGAGRSWNVARGLLLEGYDEKLTILCGRELQMSIDESVHRTLKTQIELLGMQNFYDVQRDKIYGANGTEFSFIGVKNNPNKVRSFEGIDRCWMEEANKVSKNSWEILTPTIRKKKSKIIITFNPELEEDYTYVRFVSSLLPIAKPVYCTDKDSPLFDQILWHETDDTIICKMSYHDNPWFYEDTALEADMLRAKRLDEDEYLNVWEGFPRQNLTGAIYAKELRKAQIEGRITKVPYEREIPVDTFWDLGRADKTAIWFAQQVGMQFRVLDYEEFTGLDVTEIMKVVQQKGYFYGWHHLPHDARAHHFGTKHTVEETIRKLHKYVCIVPRLSVSDGINAARQLFSQCWIDQDKCADGLFSLRRYAFKVKDGKFSDKPSHDYSDGADAFRYMAVARRMPKTSDAEGILAKLKPKVSAFAETAAASMGWMSQ